MSSPKRIKGRDIVVVGQQPWDTEIGSNCKNIAMEWSKYNRVLYVNAPLDRFSKYRSSSDPKIQKRVAVISGKMDGLLQLEENLWNLYPDCLIESINWIGNQSLFEYGNRINNKRFAKSINNAIRRLGFNDVILFNDNDMFRSFHLKELIQPFISIYYSRDFMLGVPYWKRHGEKMEPELIAQSDLCVANSMMLADYCRQYNPQSYFVGQGCELDLFLNAHQLEIPADMAGIPGPVIGYVGALQHIRLDIAALLLIAKTRPDWSLVLVGPEDETFMRSELHQCSNVYFLGSRNVSLLPAYIHSFDVCINPQLLNPITDGNYPRKIDEYLAVGKPVVATRTRAMAYFEAHCFLADSGADYISKIEAALHCDNGTLAADRINFAASHSWENSVGMIDEAILRWIHENATFA